MTYKEIERMAEERVDEMMLMPGKCAVVQDIQTALEVMLECAGLRTAYKETIELDGIAPEERERIVRKAKGCCENLMEAALTTRNRHGIANGQFMFSMYCYCDQWLKDNSPASKCREAGELNQSGL